jgi:hypothetical protein
MAEDSFGTTIDDTAIDEAPIIETRSRRRSGCALNVFNVLTAMLVIATFVIMIAVVLLFMAPDGFLNDLLGLEMAEPLPTPTLLARAEVPTLAPTSPAVGGIGGGPAPPTWTPVPARASATPPPINTLRPTLTPSITPTFPPPTPSRTPTPTPTDTPTPGPSPTVTATRSAFPFTKDLDSPQYLQNYANSAGCNWMGIAGEVLDTEGRPVAANQFVVHIWDGGVDQRVPAGGAPAYGPSGWEQYLFDAPRIQEHNIQLETTNGTAVSQVYRVQTRASCNQNLVYFVFVQNH